ncbi:unnamed protein product [Meganyctiphanes norvegica]|uniref:Uncharacterized protein n=1 Tax=Meganyctiphanes norvegica TaxID=48144 RepID=A0AAV2QF65_MEGNR
MAAATATAAATTGEVVSSSSSDELLNGGLDELYHGLVLPLLNELQRQYPLDTIEGTDIELEDMTTNGKGKRPYKVWDSGRQVRKGLVVGNFSELIDRGKIFTLL